MKDTEILLTFVLPSRYKHVPAVARRNSAAASSVLYFVTTHSRQPCKREAAEESYQDSRKHLLVIFFL